VTPNARVDHRSWTVMLFAMRKILFVVLAMCFASEAIGHAAWSLPKLKELDQSNAIGTGSLKLSAAETGLLRRITRGITSACVSDPGPGDPKTAEGIFESLRVGRVNLTANGDSALVVQGEGVCMCGAAGNCPFWLLSKGAKPKLLLKATGIQSFSVQKSRGISPFDLVLGSHDSAMETYIQRFRFDGTSYQRSGCATIEWDDETGNRLDPPRITSARCP